MNVVYRDQSWNDNPLVANPWSRAIRSAVIAWFGFGLVWSIASPFWEITPARDALATIVNFGEYATAKPPALHSGTDVAANFVWAWAVSTAAIDVLMLLSAFRRWNQGYAAVVIVLLLWLIPLGIVLISAGDIPGWVSSSTIAFAGISIALAGWMIVADVWRRASR